jgi:2'-5' RNA ligase
MSAAGYPSPPRYVGREFMEMGVTRSQVHMTLLPPPAHPECPALRIKAMGRRLTDTWETAAMRALTTFCEQHPVEVTLAPIGLFPAVKDDDPMWLDRVQHIDYLADFHAQETILTSVQCMNALYHLQALLSQGLAQATDLAQAYYKMADTRDE